MLLYQGYRLKFFENNTQYEVTGDYQDKKFLQFCYYYLSLEFVFFFFDKLNSNMLMIPSNSLWDYKNKLIWLSLVEIKWIWIKITQRYIM